MLEPRQQPLTVSNGEGADSYGAALAPIAVTGRGVVDLRSSGQSEEIALIQSTLQQASFNHHIQSLKSKIISTIVTAHSKRVELE